MKIAAPDVRLILIIPFLLAAATAGGADQRAKPNLLAHGTGETYWLAQIGPGEDPSEGDQTRLFFRSQNNDTWQPMTRIAARAVAITPFKKDLAVQLESGNWVIAWHGDSASGQQLPRAAKVVALGGTDNILWAVAALSGGIETLTKPETPATQGSTQASLQAATRSSTQALAVLTTQPSTAPSTAPATTQPAGLALFSFERGDWTGRDDLPPAIRTLGAGAISMAVINNEPIVAANTGGAIVVYRYSAADKAWIDLGSVTPAGEISRFELLGETGQPMLWIASKTGAGVLYTRGKSWSDPIPLALGDSTSVTERALAIATERIRLIFARGDKLFEQKYELSQGKLGQKIGDPAALALPIANPDATINNTIQFAVMVALLLVIFTSFRRRGMMQEAMAQPDKLALAPQGMRFLAGVIDALPLMATSIWVVSRLQVSSEDVTQQMLEAALEKPWIIAVLFVIAHTTVCELLFGRSIGKMLLGLRVVSLDGQPAKPGAIVMRNFLRIVDLTMVFTLFWILYSPLRQRLGDIAAGTVVVRGNAPPESSEQSTDSKP